MMLLNQKTTRTTLCLAVALAWAAAAQAQGNPETGDVAVQGNASQFGGQLNTGGQVSSQGASVTTQTTSQTVRSTSSVDANTGGPAAVVPADAHSAVVGHFGVGFFGVTDVPLPGCGNNGGACDQNFGNNLSAPTIGARYWMSDLLGIEAALGLHFASNSVGNVDSSAFGLAIHDGVPLALAHSGYFTFEVVPQVDLGFATGSYEVTGPGSQPTKLSGLLIQLGAKVGGEIHFGFIDLPQLALQGTLGLMIRHEGRTIKVPAGGATTTSIDQNSTDIATGVDGPPWSIFLGTLSAIYYFGV